MPPAAEMPANDAPLTTDRVPIELWAAILALTHPRTALVVSTRLVANAARLSLVLRSWAYRLVFVEPPLQPAPSSQGTFAFHNPIPSFQLDTKLSKLLQSCLPCQPGDPVHGIVLQPKPGAGLSRLPTDPLTTQQARVLSLATWLTSEQGPYRPQTSGQLGGGKDLIRSRLNSLHSSVEADLTVHWQSVPDLLHLAVFTIRLGQPEFYTSVIHRLAHDLFPNGQLTATHPVLPFTHWARLMVHDSQSIGSIMRDLHSGSDADTRLSPVQFFLWLATADWSLALFQAIPSAFGVDYASTATQFVSMLANDAILWSICLTTLRLATDPDRITSLMDHIATFKPDFHGHILSRASRFPGHMSVLLCTNSLDHVVSMRLFPKYDLPLIDQIKTIASERDKVGRAILEYCVHGHGEYLPVLFANELLDARELGLVLNRVVMHNADPQAVRTFLAGAPKDLLGEIVCQGINNLPYYVQPNLDYYASMANALHASTAPFFRTIASRENWWGLDPEKVIEVLFDVAQDQLAVPWDFDKLRAELDADPEMADKFVVVVVAFKEWTHLTRKR